jgi:hypothetical protein
MPGLDAPDMGQSEGAKQPAATKQESRAKSSSTHSVMLIDCGKASKGNESRKGPLGAFIEPALPPFARFDFY